jgi:SAM-dependent methyltransferase
VSTALDRIDFVKCEHDVNREISPHEKMGRPSEGSAEEEAYYFEAGRSALECIDISLRAARKPISEVRRILDLPCAHGRVLRYLQAAFPAAEVSACDIMRDGVDFCASTLGAVPIYSEDDPRKIPLARGAYDLIWVGSLLTHLDARLWGEFLEVFRDALSPGGLLVFTTHGRKTYRNILGGSWAYGISFYRKTFLLHDYERTGFGYVRYPDEGYYGVSLQSSAWVLKQVAKHGGLRVVHFAEQAWHRHQDCFGCVRDDSPDYRAESLTIPRWKYVKHRLGEIKHRLRGAMRHGQATH